MFYWSVQITKGIICYRQLIGLFNTIILYQSILDHLQAVHCWAQIVEYIMGLSAHKAVFNFCKDRSWIFKVSWLIFINIHGEPLCLSYLLIKWAASSYLSYFRKWCDTVRNSQLILGLNRPTEVNDMQEPSRGPAMAEISLTSFT